MNVDKTPCQKPCPGTSLNEGQVWDACTDFAYALDCCVLAKEAGDLATHPGFHRNILRQVQEDNAFNDLIVRFLDWIAACQAYPIGIVSQEGRHCSVAVAVLLQYAFKKLGGKWAS